MEPRLDPPVSDTNERPPFAPLGFALRINADDDQFPEAMQEWAKQIIQERP